MTIQGNIGEAKAKLSALIEAAEKREQIIIARIGEPVAELRARSVAKNRRIGVLKERYSSAGAATPIEAFAPDPDDEYMAPLSPVSFKSGWRTCSTCMSSFGDSKTHPESRPL